VTWKDDPENIGRSDSGLFQHTIAVLAWKDREKHRNFSAGIDANPAEFEPSITRIKGWKVTAT